MTLSQAFSAYCDDVIVFKNQSAKTEENHNVCLRALLIHFGDIEIESLTFHLVRDWKLALEKGNKRSVLTIRNYLTKLRNVIIYLEKRGVTVVNSELITLPKRVDKVPVFLNKEQVAQCIYATQRIKNKAIISLLYASGIRISELCSLDRGQLHDRTFTVVGKGSKARLCFYDERTEFLIEQYLQTRTDNVQALFLSDAKERIRPGTIQETFKTIRKQTGLEVHPHALRHSFATNLLQTNTNLFHVQRMLGHSQLSTTQQYLHVVDHDLRKVYMEHHTV